VNNIHFNIYLYIYIYIVTHNCRLVDCVLNGGERDDDVSGCSVLNHYCQKRMVRPFQSYWASACYATHNNEIIIDEVQNIIIKSPSKCCSLDPVPTQFVKLCVGELIYIITAIVNVYLHTNRFLPAFMGAQLRSLIRKPILDP